MMSMLTIGKLAKQARLSTDCIRFYERQGLISPASKSGSGYRLYAADALHRLSFIRHAQACGFPLAEIRELLDFPSHSAGGWRPGFGGLIEKRLKIDEKVRSLRCMSEALEKLIELLSQDDVPRGDCTILSMFEPV